MRITMPAHIAQSPIYPIVWNRVWGLTGLHGGNWNWVVDGLGRTGKSTTCIGIGKDLDVTPKGEFRFDVDQAICLSYKVLVKRIDEISFKERGRVLIWEESSGFEGANSREYASAINKKLAKITQIIGIKGIILLINLPSMYDLDKQIRKLCHSKTTMDHIVESERMSVGSFKLLNPHKYKNEIFESYIISRNSIFMDYMKNVEFPWAPTKMYDRYLDLEREYKDKWFHEATQEVLKGKEIPHVKATKYNQTLNYLEPKIKEYWNPVTHKFDYDKIFSDLYKSEIHVGRSTLNDVLQSLKGELALA